jgi:predicted ATPase/class 3 adenylate cyclase
VRFEALGTLAVYDDQAVHVSGTRRRSLLLRLLMAAPNGVSADRLASDLWGDDATEATASTLQSHISLLRRAIGAGRVRWDGAAYSVVLDDAGFDVNEFESHLREAEAASASGRTESAVRAWHDAHRLWRGTAYADVADAQWARVESARLGALHLGAVEGWLAARLDLGETSSVAAEAERFADAHPYRERLWEVLMLAQYRAGRQIDALRTFQRVRDMFGEELGVEPGPALVQLERAILEHDPALASRGPDREETAGVVRERSNASSRGAGSSRALPTGVVTFFLTDLVDSTKLWDADPAVMEAALAAHDDLVATVVSTHGGALLKFRGEGDSTLSVFQRATDAVTCAVQLRSAIARFQWPGEPLRARMAVHTGEAVERDADFFGPAVNRAARIRAHATADQILVSAVAAGIVADRLRKQIQLVDLGPVQLRGITGDEHLFEVSPIRSGVGVLADGLSGARDPVALACREDPMAGLDAQLKALLGHWHAACAGIPRLVVVRGDCGSGKTRLVAELAAAVSAMGGVTLYAGCRSDEAFAFEALAEAIARAAPASESASHETLTVPAVVPALAPVRGPGAGLERWLRGDAFVECAQRLDEFEAQIRMVASDSPVVLIVDDAQWLDAETSELFTAVLDAELRLPLLIVMTTEPDVTTFPDSLVDGSAMVVDVPAPAERAAAPTPTSVSTAATRLLEFAVVAGGELPGALIASSLPDERGETIAAARDELVAAGLVRRAGDRIAVVDHAISVGVRASLSEQQLAALHGRIGRALVDGAGGIVDGRRVASHLLRGDGDRQLAIDVARRVAADSASRGLLRDAQRWAESTLEAARAADLAEDAVEVQLLSILATAEAQRGAQGSRCLAALQKACVTLGRVDPLAEAAIGRAEWLVCGARDSNLINACREALRMDAAPLDTTAHVRLKVALAFALSAAGDPDAASEASSALDVARTTGNERLVSLALAACRAATAGSWDFVRRRRLADEQLLLASDGIRRVDALLCRSEVRLASSDAAGAASDQEAAAADLSVADRPTPSVRLAAAATALRVGDFTKAELEAEAAAGFATPGSELELAAAIIRVWLAHERGSQLEQEALGTGGSLEGPLADVVSALRCVDNADEDAASALYARLAPGSGRVVVTLGSVCLGPCDYYLGLLAGVMQRPAAAIRHLRQALELCERTGMTPAAVRARVALAKTLLQRRAPGDMAEARRLAGEASADAEEIGMPALLEVAREQLADAGGGTDSDEWPLIRQSEPDPLPPELTNLVGRDDVVAEVIEHVRNHRLTTLWGPGGVGKTRIAVRAAREVLAAFPDGVWFVDLTETGPDGSVAEAVLAAVHGQRRGEQSTTDAVIAALAAARMLLVVDNCEHLLEEARSLTAEVLRHARDLHILVTSRETLGIPSETVVEVLPLDVPADLAPDVETVLASPAAQLFLDRATAASGSFVVDEHNAGQVAALCRYTGGVPLAVELAAGRLDVESLAELVARSGPAGVLEGLAARGLTSHKAASLTASFAWSYEQLDAESQVLFRTVSVFAAPFTREMALAAHPHDARDGDRSFDRLVRAALISRTSRQGHRFRMLEPVRQFARARSEADELEGVQSRLATVMLARAERFGPQIRTADEIPATEVLVADLADYRAAMTWLIGAGDPRAAQMIIDLFQFCLFHMVPEAASWAALTAAQLPDDNPAAPAVWGAGALASWLEGRMGDAIDLGEQSVLLAGKLGEQPPFWALLALVDAYGFTGNIDRMTDAFQRLTTAARSSPDPFWRVMGLGYESMALLVLGQPERARSRAETALATARELGNPECLQWSLYSLGRAWATIDDRLAADAFDEAIAVTRPVDSRWGRCINLIEWVGAERRLGFADTATAGLLELLQLLTANGHRSLLSQTLREVAYVLHACGDDDTAVVALLSRVGLPDAPVLSGVRDEPLTDVLRDATGDKWERLRLQARTMPETDLVRLCRVSLERVSGSS